MKNIVLKTLQGDLAREFVDPLYELGGAKSRARDTDIFFIAFLNDEAVGTVRFCIEENYNMLRSMLIHPDYRGQRLGEKLLHQFENYVIDHNRQDVYCLPYSHLESFYGKIDFETIESNQAPSFLVKRFQSYRSEGIDCILMRRD